MGCRHTGESLLKAQQQNTPGYFLKWLTVELAPTIMGEKPSILLTFTDNNRFHRLSYWRNFGAAFLRQAVIDWTIMRQSLNSITILFYHPDSLERCLEQADNCRFLAAFGYSSEYSLAKNMDYLKQRYQHGCPHEIGVFLGIPLKDVLGFMGKGRECGSCRGMWRIYGDPAVSLQVMDKIDASKRYVAKLLNSGISPRKILLADRGKTA